MANILENLRKLSDKHNQRVKLAQEAADNVIKNYNAAKELKKEVSVKKGQPGQTE